MGTHGTYNGVRPDRSGFAGRLAERRALNTGFGDAMATAAELALLPLIFGGLGWLVDRWLGTSPVFVVGLSLFAFAGMLVRSWLGYDSEMRRHENELAWKRQGRPAAGAAGDADEGAA